MIEIEVQAGERRRGLGCRVVFHLQAENSVHLRAGENEQHLFLGLGAFAATLAAPPSMPRSFHRSHKTTFRSCATGAL